MSHETTAYSDNGANSKMVAETESYMGGYRMLYEQTDWDFYNSLGAPEFNASWSGSGKGKYIDLDVIEDSWHQLNNLDPKGRLSSEGRDEFTHRQPKLMDFLSKIINWCKKNDKNKVYIFFG